MKENIDPSQSALTNKFKVQLTKTAPSVSVEVAGDTPEKEEVVDESTHPNSCNRCYRLKKKCTRRLPHCFNCDKAGETCEYATRSNKRRKKITVGQNEKIIGNINQSSFTQEEGFQNSPVFHLSHSSTNKSQIVEGFRNRTNGGVAISDQLKFKWSSPGNSDNPVQLSISSLLTGEAETATNTSSKPARKPDFPITNKWIKSAFKKDESRGSVKEELINMKPIPNDLVEKFFNLFFFNFRMRYPFSDGHELRPVIESTNFENESIISFDLYLILCIGCIMSDYNNYESSSRFELYFNKNIIEDIIDSLRFKNLDDLKMLFLLNIYSSVTLNLDLNWELIGIITKLIFRLDLFTRNDTAGSKNELYYWTGFYLDKLFSFIVNKPSFFPDHISNFSLPLESSLQTHYHDVRDLYFELPQLQARLLNLKFVRDIKKTEILTADIDSWYLRLSKKLSGSKQNDLISLTNIHYNYLMIEICHLNDNEMNQMVIPQYLLQFYTNSYNLLISSQFSIVNNVWVQQFFNVTTSSNMFLLKSCFNKTTKVINLQSLMNYKNLLQISINILRFLKNVIKREWVQVMIDLFDDLNVKLMEINAVDEDMEYDEIIEEIYKIDKRFTAILKNFELVL